MKPSTSLWSHSDVGLIFGQSVTVLKDMCMHLQKKKKKQCDFQPLCGSLKPQALGGASLLEVHVSGCCCRVVFGENGGHCGEFVVVAAVNSLRKNALSVFNSNLFHSQNTRLIIFVKTPEWSHCHGILTGITRFNSNEPHSLKKLKAKPLQDVKCWPGEKNRR